MHVLRWKTLRMDKRVMRWASSWCWGVRLPLEELFTFARVDLLLARVLSRVELLFVFHHHFFLMMSFIGAVSLWVKRLGLRWLILV